MSSGIEIRVNARMWSRTVSLKPIAARLGHVSFSYDKGEDIVFFVRGERRTRRSRENYLSTEDVKIAEVSAVRSEVARQAGLLQDDPSISQLIDERALDAVVWAAIFADEGAVSIDDLNIDTTPFGPRLGLVVDNFTEFDREGIPVKLLIGPAANRKSA